MADNEEIKKQIDFLFRKILTIERFLEKLNFKSYSPDPSYSLIRPLPSDLDELFEDAVKIVCAHDRASSSLLQRRLAIGFNRAARLIEQLEEEGVVGPAEGSEPRNVLINDADKFLKSKK